MVTDTAFLSELRAILPSDAIAVDDATRRRASVDRSRWDEDAPLPFAVLRPSAVDEVSLIMRAANRHRVAVVPRGAGTGLSGGANAIAGGVVLDLSELARILSIDPVAGTAVVEPGVLNADLDRRAAEHGLMFAPDPASAGISTVGGNIATNAGGLRCIKYGTTRQSVLGLTVVLANGDVVELGGRTRKNVTGLDVMGLIVGSEGTLGVIVRATVALVPRPAHEAMLVAACSDADIERAVIAASTAEVVPSLLELMDHASVGTRADHLLDRIGLPAAYSALIIVKTDGEGAEAEITAIRSRLRTAGLPVSAALSREDAEEMMAIRRGDGPVGEGDPQIAGDDRWWLGEDMTIPTSSIASFLSRARVIAAHRDVAITFIAHIGDGNLHPSISLPRSGTDAAEARARMLAAADDLIRIAASMGGSLSGEHGIGIAKKSWLPMFQSPELLGVQRAIKAAMDPLGILNPGKAL
jgi:glycolate oxidase